MVQWLTNRVIRGLSNGAILNDLDGPKPNFKVRPFFDAEYFQNSKMASDMAVVTMEGE